MILSNAAKEQHYDSEEVGGNVSVNMKPNSAKSKFYQSLVTKMKKKKGT